MATFVGGQAPASTTVRDVRHLRAGETVDGFRLETPLPPGGMASFWRVTHPDFALPLIMKIPLLRPGEDPITIVGYEMERMIRACTAHTRRASSRRGRLSSPIS
jgi:hypothetical protein